MREGTGKILGILICVVMICYIPVMDQSIIDKPEGNDTEVTVAEDEDAQAISEPHFRETRSDYEGTILGEPCWHRLDLSHLLLRIGHGVIYPM